MDTEPEEEEKFKLNLPVPIHFSTCSLTIRTVLLQKTAMKLLCRNQYKICSYHRVELHACKIIPKWLGFNSWSWRHMWVEFVVGFDPLLQGFFSGYSSFPPSTKTNIFKFQFNLETVERRATPQIPLESTNPNPNPNRLCQKSFYWRKYPVDF